MDFFPVFFNIKQQPCLVVGGGDIAFRKIQLLLKAGGEITVVSPDVCEAVQKLVNENKVKFVKRQFEKNDIQHSKLVISATDDNAVNVEVSGLANAANIPVNVVDSPNLCSFIVPSIVDRSPVVVAVSSGGSSPVLARLLRARLETLIPSAYGRLAQLVEGFRNRVKNSFDNTNERRRFWEKVLQGPVTELMFAGQEKQAEAMLEKMVSQGKSLVDGQGEVYLVGAGPGDPDLLTFRALRLLQQADVIVYDRLVSEPILEMARKDADRVYVGKQKKDHTVPQEDINELLVTYAKQGKRVLRLKGGDPFIFGRGGEEIERLMDAGIAFQVVPGVTAAAGCASYSGIPLTHRDHAQSVVFATGHLKDNSIDLNWDALVQKNQTIVFYMGLTGVRIICSELVGHGMSDHTNVALIQQGTTPDQKVYISTLKKLPDEIDKLEIKPPTLIIVGSVVSLHEKLSWFQPGNAK